MPETDFEEKMILIRRTARMQAGGRRFRFGALVVVGDRQGRVGLGFGKAPEVPLAVQKAGYYARRNMVEVPLQNGTIPHEIEVEFGASKIVLKPAAPGTGVIAGAVPRAILELAGVTDILTKELGSRNPINIAYATMEALRQLRTKADVERLRQGEAHAQAQGSAGEEPPPSGGTWRRWRTSCAWRWWNEAFRSQAQPGGQQAAQAGGPGPGLRPRQDGDPRAQGAEVPLRRAQGPAPL